ncbi:hypothetical protein VTI28DRAFT_4259 [Corynascus sepedonium]
MLVNTTKRMLLQKLQTFTAVIAAAVLAYIPFHKPLPALGNRFVKYVLMPGSQVKVDDEEPIWMGLRPLIPIESRLPRAREDPCSFRTRLIDPLAGSDVDVALESSGMLSSGDLRFDDTQCVSIGRWTARFKANSEISTSPNTEHEQANETAAIKNFDLHLFSTAANEAVSQDGEVPETIRSAAVKNARRLTVAPVSGRECQGWPSIRKTLNDHTTAPCAYPNNDDGETDVNMETMNMPFWDLPRRPKRLASCPGDAIPDDMSIISDASLIPTYYPSDIMKQQQQQRPRQRARLIKRLIRAKARAARQTVRELRRSCRDAVEHVFVEPTAAAAVHKGTKCLAVGSMY